MKKPKPISTEPPPLLAYIEANRDEERHATRRRDAEAAIARLYQEQAELIAADQSAPAEIVAANMVVLEIAALVAEAEEALASVMEKGETGADLRQVLADRRGQLVDARSRLDNLTRQAADRARRLSQITPDVESWDDRRHAAAMALRHSRKKRGAD